MPRIFKANAATMGGAALARETPELLPRHAFAASLARCLRLLRGIHVPITLFAVALPAGEAVEADASASAALLPFGVVGRLPDGRIGLLYLGPHSPGDAGERALSAHLLARIVERLRDRGWGALCRGVTLSAAHAWSDAITGPAALLRALDDSGAPQAAIGTEDARSRPHEGAHGGPSRAP